MARPAWAGLAARDDTRVVRDLDARAASYREQLVAVLQDRGVASPAIIDAFSTVPRHRFVGRFWVAGPAAPPPGGLSVDDHADDVVLELVHDPDRALLSASPGEATSSVSAPYLIAGMLAELDLAPGMRVLEIGAGSGYHAALIASIVGSPELVTTIDIDRAMVDQTRKRLTHLGYGAISVLCGDGHDAVPDGAFDRIVATVGCNDISPAWTEHLAHEGTLLVPLVHGAAHPRVRLAKRDGVLSGDYPGYSGFVSIQGAQAGHSPWPDCSAPHPNTPTRRHLPAALAAALVSPDPTRPHWNPREWALGFYVALRDGRAASTAGLLDRDSFAGIEQGRIAVAGPRGSDLAQELLADAQDWLQMAAPGLERYHTSFTPAALDTPGVPAASVPEGPWAIRRLRHTQTIRLDVA